MVRKWLTWANYLIAALAVLCAALGFAFLVMRPSSIEITDNLAVKTGLPKKSFILPPEAYVAVGNPLLSLQFAPMSMQLPDLKRHLVYYGKNGRPDAALDKPLLHFSFTGNKIISSASPGERLYILYDRTLHPPQYVFSPNNQPTSLWMEAEAKDNEAHVNVSMKGETGEILTNPQENARFILPEKEFVRFGGASWEIGKNRVDATLLARQRARWYGSDLFFERHGGPEYKNYIGKQRIDFGEGEELYSTFVGVQDALIWDNERWKQVQAGPATLGKPLLVVKKIDERLMNLELWDPDGKGKVLLNLLKSVEASQQQNILANFKFVGARTRTQFVFEVDKERMLLSPKDWLLLTQQGWIKLSTPQEIDDYVERKLTGPLFVFDEVERKDDRSSLKGTLFNTARTDLQEVELPLQQCQSKSSGKAGSKNGKRHLGHGHGDDDDDEDDEDDDDNDEDFDEDDDE